MGYEREGTGMREEGEEKEASGGKWEGMSSRENE